MITIVILLITLLISNHEPPSRAWGLGFPQKALPLEAAGKGTGGCLQMGFPMFCKLFGFPKTACQGLTIGASIIRKGFEGIVYYTINIIRNPQNRVGN